MTYINKGDVSYWDGTDHILDFEKNPIAPDRDFYVNGEGMANVIFGENPGYEGDIVPIGEYAGQNFAYAWWRDSKDPEARMSYGRLKAAGYDFVTTENFKVVRESFFEEDGKICFGDTVLMACPEERWKKNKRKEQEREAKKLGAALDAADNEFANSVDKVLSESGVKTFEPVAGSHRK